MTGGQSCPSRNRPRDNDAGRQSGARLSRRPWSVAASSDCQPTWSAGALNTIDTNLINCPSALKLASVQSPRTDNLQALCKEHNHSIN